MAAPTRGDDAAPAAERAGIAGSRQTG
jgi:hypothetical protein